MNFNLMVGTITTVVLFLPPLLIAGGRLISNGSLLGLFFYYLFTAIYNLMTLNFMNLPLLVKRYAAVCFNYLDTPLMLLILLFFCNERWKRRLVFVALAFFLLYEIAIGILFRLDVESSVYLLGPGTLLILGLSIFFFTHYGKITIVHGKEVGKTFMLVSILFSYGCFLVLYYLHYLLRTPAVADVFLIYYIDVLLSTILMSIGLFWLIKRNRELKELQITRKELALFFDN